MGYALLRPTNLPHGPASTPLFRLVCLGVRVGLYVVGAVMSLLLFAAHWDQIVALANGIKIWPAAYKWQVATLDAILVTVFLWDGGDYLVKLFLRAFWERPWQKPAVPSAV